MSFRRHPNAEDRKRSAVILVKAILQLPGLYPAHRRDLLRTGLWMVTEAECLHKHKTRYRSMASLAPGSKLRHDHVFQRSFMVDQLQAHPEDADAILASAIGCTITEQEHKDLEKFKHLDGWERYAKAKIVLVDTESNRELASPAEAITVEQVMYLVQRMNPDEQEKLRTALAPRQT